MTIDRIAARREPRQIIGDDAYMQLIFEGYVVAPPEVDRRLYDLHVEALAEIKATVDGESDQPVKDIIYGLLAEIDALPDASQAPRSGYSQTTEVREITE